MFGLFVLFCVVTFIVWRVKKSKSVGDVYPDVTLDVDDDPKPIDWGASSYTPSVPTRTTYKPRASTSRTKPSSNGSSGGGFGGGGFGGGRSGGGGSSSGW